jgi:tripeptidyl-peptidase-1
MMRSFLVPLLALLSAGPVVHATFFEPSRSLGDWAIATDSPLSGDQSIKFRVALKPKDLAKVNEALNAVATPGNPRYRAYLDRAALSALVAPEPAAAAHAEAWLIAGGGRVVEHSALGDWLTMEATVDNIQAMFQTTLTRFRNRRTGAEKVATTGSYEIPAEVDSVIALVAGMNSFSAFRATAVAPAGSATSPQGAPATITPDTLASVYGVSDAGSHGSKMGSQAVVEFGNLANFNEADLQDFFTALAPTLEGETCGTAYGNNNGDIRASVEANLDVQYIMAAGAWVETFTYKITEGAGIEDEMLNYAYIVNNESNPALVHSISYGEYGGSYDNATDHQFDHELMKMGLAGVSVLLASGDNGVGCSASGSTEEFDFPDSPHITMVSLVLSLPLFYLWSIITSCCHATAPLLLHMHNT